MKVNFAKPLHKRQFKNKFIGYLQQYFY